MFLVVARSTSSGDNLATSSARRQEEQRASVETSRLVPLIMSRSSSKVELEGFRLLDLPTELVARVVLFVAGELTSSASPLHTDAC